MKISPFFEMNESINKQSVSKTAHLPLKLLPYLGRGWKYTLSGGGGCLPPSPSKHPKSLWKNKFLFCLPPPSLIGLRTNLLFWIQILAWITFISWNRSWNVNLKHYFAVKWAEHYAIEFFDYGKRLPPGNIKKQRLNWERFYRGRSWQTKCLMQNSALAIKSMP